MGRKKMTDEGVVKDQKQDMQDTMEAQTLEEVFGQLEQVLGQMEEEQTLEDSFGLYRQGMDMLKVCNEKIDKVEKQMLVLDERGEVHEL